MTNDSISNSPLPSALFPSICDIQTFGSSDDVHKGTESHREADAGKKKEYKANGHKGEKCEDKEARRPDKFVTPTGVTGLRDFFKRTADNAGLNEGGDSAHRLEKVRCAGECADLHCHGRV